MAKGTRRAGGEGVRVEYRRVIVGTLGASGCPFSPVSDVIDERKHNATKWEKERTPTMKDTYMRQIARVAMAVLGLIGSTFGQDATTNAAVVSAPKPTGAIFVYCAAGARDGIVAVAKAFEAETGVKVETTFANSGQLLGQIEMTRKGDVYVPGDVGFIAKAEDKNLTQGKAREFCYFVPGMFVRKGNPKGIKDITDLVKPGLKLALADPSAAIGQLQTQVFKKNNLDEEALKKNTVTSPATVTDVAMAVKMGTADAAIIWDALRNFAPEDAELVSIPPEKNVVGVVPAAVLTSSKNPAAATAFVDYLVSEKGRAILKAKGYSVDKP